MLTLKAIRMVSELQRTLGIGLGGACFGVSDPNKLRPPPAVCRDISSEISQTKKSAAKTKPNKRSKQVRVTFASIKATP